MNFGDSVQIKGCTVKSRHLETSSGNSAIDSLIGGGLPNTSITVVDETQSRVYADTLVKYFVAEGLYNQHDIFIADPSGSPSSLWENIPSRATSSSQSQSIVSSSPSPDSMKIAWRYGATPQVQSSIGSANNYDLRKPFEGLDSVPCMKRSYPEKNKPASYAELYSLLSELLKSDNYSKQRGPKKNLLRVVIRHLGSPLWADSENLSIFIARLQLITRSAYVVVMATTCSPSLPPQISNELEVAADLYIRLVAMTDEEKKLIPSLDKFHGYFNIICLPRLTSVSTHRPHAVDLVFELHRKSFDVKILHLPPALGDSETNSTTKTPCGADF